MRILFVAAVLLIAGCSKPPHETLPTETIQPGEEYITDPSESEIQEEYDFLSGNFTELNGSVVLSLKLRDVHTPVPRMVNVFDVVVDGERTTFFARTFADRTRPAPHINYELGSIKDGKETRLGDICGIHGAAETPPQILFDLPHNLTGLEGGGTIVRLHVEVRNFEDETLYDSAQTEKSYAVQGGASPHGATCPLIAERANRS